MPPCGELFGIGFSEGLSLALFYAIGGSFNPDQVGVVDESVDDPFGADHVVEYFAPIFEGPVGRYDRGGDYSGVRRVYSASVGMKGEPERAATVS